MIWAAAILLFMGNLVHSWYGGNCRVKTVGDQALLFMLHRKYVLAVGIVLLVAGLISLWIAKGLLWVIVAAIGYYYILPMVTLPLIVALGLLPRYTLPWLDKDA